ncbi:MAG: hypothetical protein AAFQ20_13735 [Bacteroidota bacterium]
MYSNIPVLYDNMYALADGPTRTQMRKNKDFIICFPQVGLQFTPEDDLFESRMVVNYQNMETVKQNEQFREEPKMTVSKPTVTKTEAPTESVFQLKPIYPSDLTAKSFVKKYGSGAIRYEVELKDGLKHGRYEEFYPNGEKKMTGRFRKDEQVGTWRYFDTEGELLLKKRF